MGPTEHVMLQVGDVVKPHGLRGEVVVHLVTNRLERVAPGTRLVCIRPSARARSAARPPISDAEPVAALAEPPFPSELEILESRPHQGRHLVKFQGISTLEQAEALRGAVLEAEPIEDPEAFFVHELIGCEVVDVAGQRRGSVTAVEANPASDLLVLDDRHYVPLRFVVERLPGRLVIDPPDGLFD